LARALTIPSRLVGIDLTHTPEQVIRVWPFLLRPPWAGFIIAVVTAVDWAFRPWRTVTHLETHGVSLVGVETSAASNSSTVPA
jgi:hypothetical protein